MTNKKSFCKPNYFSKCTSTSRASLALKPLTNTQEVNPCEALFSFCSVRETRVQQSTCVLSAFHLTSVDRCPWEAKRKDRANGKRKDKETEWVWWVGRGNLEFQHLDAV